jgi:hypothetical protein
LARDFFIADFQLPIANLKIVNLRPIDNWQSEIGNIDHAAL